MMAQGVTYDGIPLTITNVSDSNTDIRIIINGGLAPLLYYKKGKGKTYRKWKYNNISLQPQESIDIFGDNPSGFSKSVDEYAVFRITGGVVSVGGKISALSATMVDFMFYRLFTNCSVTNIEEGLFEGIDTLKNNCFRSMFDGCSKLTDVPANLLPFTTLKEQCYYNMFSGTSLTKIKSGFLPATNIPIDAYSGMFRHTKINTIEQDAISATSIVYAERMFCNTPIDENSFKEGSLKKIYSVGNGSFTRIFDSCKFSKIPPQIQLEANSNYTYQGAFINNKQLIELDSEAFNSLKIVGSGSRLYSNTFNGCTSLQKVEIPFNQSQVNGHNILFQYTFKGCSSLNEIVVHFTSWKFQRITGGELKTFNITEEWLSGVSPTGTFTCTKELAEETDGYYDEEGNFVEGVGRSESTVPEGWTIDYPIIDARDGDANAMSLMAVISQQTHADGTPWVKDSLVMMKSEAEKVEDIGTVFRGNNSITNFDAFEFFTRITTIPDYGFNGMRYLTSIKFPNNLSIINSYAFESCANLPIINLPNSLQSIGYRAFRATNTTSLYIPDSVTFIDGGITAHCTTVTSIEVSTDNTEYYSGEYNAIIEKNTNKFIMGCKNSTIPNETKVIGNGAFNGVPITTITLPDGLEEIGELAFAACSVTELIIPDSVTKIGNGALGYLLITHLSLPKSLALMEGNLLCGCSKLESLDIPSSVTSIGHGCLADCKNLNRIVYGGTTEQWVSIGKGYNWNKNVPTTCVIECTDGTLNIS